MNQIRKLLADRAIERAAHDGDGTAVLHVRAAADALIAEIMRERDSLTADLAHIGDPAPAENVIGDLIGGFAKVSVPAPSSSYTDPKTAPSPEKQPVAAPPLPSPPVSARKK